MNIYGVGFVQRAVDPVSLSDANLRTTESDKKLIEPDKDILDLTTQGLSSEETRAVGILGDGFHKVRQTLEAMKTITGIAEEEWRPESDRLSLQEDLFRLQGDLHRMTHDVALSLGEETYDSTLATDGVLSMGFSPLEIDKASCTIQFSMLHDAQMPLSQCGLPSGYQGLRVVSVREDPDHPAAGQGEVAHWLQLVATGKGRVLPSYIDKALDRIKEARDSGKTLNDLSKDPFIRRSRLFLGDSASSMKATEEIDKGLGRLDEMIGKVAESLRKIASDPRKEAARQDELLFPKSGMEDMRFLARTELGDLTFRYGADLSDMRFIAARGAVGQLFSKVDTFLKDDLYRSLGVGKLFF